MTVRSQDLPPAQPKDARASLDQDKERRRNNSAIFRRSDLRKARTPIERSLAVFILLAGVLGTLAAFHGSWAPIVRFQFNPAATFGGLGLQAALTGAQWMYHDRPWVSWPARAIDTFLTALGYGPLLLGALTGMVAAGRVTLGSPAALAGLPDGGIAWGIIALVSLLVAWYPETRLVD